MKPKYQLLTSLALLFLGVSLTLFFLKSVYFYASYYKNTTTGEVVGFSKTSSEMGHPIILFKDDRDEFRQFTLPKNLNLAQDSFVTLGLDRSSSGKLSVLLMPDRKDNFMFLFIILAAFAFFYCSFICFRKFKRLNYAHLKGFQFCEVCSACKKSINYNYYSNFAERYPHFYCDSCSNVIWRKSDRDKVLKQPPSQRNRLLILINTTLPKCQCGGNFRIDANPKCPNCRSEIRHKVDLLDRLIDPHMIVVEGAKETFIYDP